METNFKKGFNLNLNFIFWLIITLAVIFRFGHLDNKVFWHDEIYTELRISGYKDAEPREARFGKIISKQEFLRFQGVSELKGIKDTLSSLSQDTQMPLYYILLKYWQDLWGNSIIAIRSLSALFSVLTLPALYLLARELFDSDFTAKITTSLMAVSPMFIRYAQEARAYSLWTLSIVISTYLLLKAIKTNKNRYWLFYAVSIATSSYSQLLSFFIYLGHFIYVAFAQIKKINIFFKYACATILGTSLFLPFLILDVLPRLDSIKGQTRWLTSSIPKDILFQEQISNIYHLFVSVNLSSFDKTLIYILVIPIIILILYSIFILIKNNRVSTWLVPAILTITGLICLYQDLRFGGQRTRINQYFLSTYIAIIIAVGFSISFGIKSNYKRTKFIWKSIFTFVISVAVISNIYTSFSPTWWGWSSFQVDMANIINNTEKPLVISQNRIGIVLPLFYLLNDNSKSLMLNLNLDKLPVNIDKYNIFLLNPSPEVKDKYENISNKKLIKVYVYKDNFVTANLYKSL